MRDTSGRTNDAATPGEDPGARFWLTVAPATDAAGLDSATAQARLARDGANRIGPPPAHRLAGRILRRLAEPLVLILLMAAAVSGASGDRVSVVIILLIVAISVGLDVWQEHGAEQAAEALRRSIAQVVRVCRDGKLVTLPAEEIVAGDVAELRPGDLVPADGIVLESRGARVDEAILTGEPYPVDKRPGPSNARDMADAYDALFSGTAVINGEARMLVVATGARTRFGAISAGLETDEPPSAFERGLHKLGVLILRLTLSLVLFVLLVQVMFHRPLVESVMFAVALAVGLTPELLPMVMTVTLSRGALRMAGKQVIVKRLASIHDLGAMDVLCTDKTGTLTQARIALAAHPGPDGQDSDRVLELAALNARFASGDGNPLDAAILAAAPAEHPEWQRLAALPFDFERRRASVLVERGGERLLICKGAPEAMLAQCDRIATANGEAPLDDAGRAALAQAEEARAGSGERLLAVAWKRGDAARDSVVADDETGLVFAGFCCFLDPVKPSAGEALRRFAAMGVRVKVISGDAAPVVRHLAASVGMERPDVLTGADMERLSDRELRARLRHVDLFARVSPDQKVRIIRSLSRAGHTVGFIGDGINDAPAIRAADAGLSVDTATDVARAAADMILLANDLNVVADGIIEGRRTYGNIIKYVRMGTSSNFGNMLSMALASLVIPFLPMTAIQILLNNLLYDLSQTGIPFDRVDADELNAPHNWQIGAIKRFTGLMGPLSSVFDIATFALLLLAFHAGAAEFRTAWFVESMLTQILVIFVIRTRGKPWQSRAHPALVVSSLGALALALLLALGPWATLLGFAPLPPALLAATVALAAAYLVCAQALKRRARGD